MRIVCGACGEENDCVLCYGGKPEEKRPLGRH